MTAPRDNKAVILDLIAAANAGDLERVAAAYAEDFRDHADDGSRRGGGKDAAVRAFRELIQAFPDTFHLIDDVIAEGDRVVLRLRAEGTHTGSYRGIAPSGRRVRMRTTAIYRLKDGLVVERWCDGASAVADQLPRVAGEPCTVRVLDTSTAPWTPDPSGGRYQELALGSVSLTRFELGAGARFERHDHPNEQITFVLEGELTFDLGDREHLLGPGDGIALPGGVPHAVRAGDRPVVAVDAWAPPPSHLGYCRIQVS